jgi:hypothetical protein
MHGVVNLESIRKQKRKEAWMWHKKMNRDPELSGPSVRLANEFVQSFEFATTGTAKYSRKDAQRDLQLSKPTACRAFQQLLGRQWLIPTNEKDCYRPGPGPFHN